MKYILSVPPSLSKSFFDIETRDPEKWFVTSDPPGKRIGSGGGTAYCLTECAKKANAGDFLKWLSLEKRIIIHAAGHGRRLPAYAPVGKILTPLPVFRWSRGQSIKQKLIDLQLQFLNQVVKKAGPRLNTMVVSGDVLIYLDDAMPDIPDADIVCLGVWKEPEKCINHGVFFVERENHEVLATMLQKPSLGTIKEMMGKYDFLIDIGVWLLSDKAVEVLMKKTSWQPVPGAYKNETPSFYDLYSDFGASMGNKPAGFDEEISNLSVKIVPLDKGEFYHFGTTTELIESTGLLQNRVLNQREIYHRDVKPHSSIFTLNSITGIKFTSNHENIWIENSYVPRGFHFNRDHVVTGLPENNWELKMAPGSCIDMVPLENNHFCIRFYGYHDSFKGTVKDNETLWMGIPAPKWFDNRGIDIDEVTRDNPDIQFAAIFPVLEKEAITSGFLQWLYDPGIDNEINREIYMNSEKISASGISDSIHFRKLYDQREAYLVKNIVQLANNHGKSIFYQVDLEEVAGLWSREKLSLPEKPIPDDNLFHGISDYMFRSLVKKKNGEDSLEDENKSFELLKNGIINADSKLHSSPVLSMIADQIVWGRSPVRIDLAGGWTDTPPYCMLNGGKVLNIALNLNGQPPLQCFVKPSTENSIVMRSIDLGAEEKITTYEQVEDFNKIGSPFSITRAALALAGFSPRFNKHGYRSLEKQLKAMGGGLEVTTLSMIPKGSGLGTSSILAATVLGTLNEACNLGWNKLEIGKKTILLEQLLTTGGGWQDQFGGILGGVKFLVSSPGFEQSPVVRWLPDYAFNNREIKPLLLLYYTGITRVAKNILAEIVRGMFLNSNRKLCLLSEIGNHAGRLFDEMQKGNYRHLGKMTDYSWQLNQRLDPETNTPAIQAFLDRVEPYLDGKKLLGAGGGGFMLMIAKSLEDAKKVQNILKENPPNDKARFVDFDVSGDGLVVTKS